MSSTGPGTTIGAVGSLSIQSPPVLTPMEHLRAPAGLLHLPKQSGLFVGRDRDMARLRKALVSTTPVVAVHGLGGVGKSTLAAHYAAMHQTEYSVVWWITADSSAAIEAGLAALATAIQPTVAALSPEQQVSHGVTWLASHKGWLLILDNVSRPEDVQGLLARVAAGTILITSRRASGWHVSATPLAVDVLEPTEAITLLTQILSHSHTTSDLAGAERLCEELGYLPLAIDQAGAYLAQTGLAPADYLDLLTRYPAVMFAEREESTDTEQTIARIWHITLDQLADTPEAGDLLRVLAWYAPKDIPRSLLHGLADEPTLLRAIRRLTAYSMISVNRHHINVHRLVQAVARTPEPDDRHRTPDNITNAFRAAARSLARALTGKHPHDPDAGPLYLTVLPHVWALADHSDGSKDTADTADLLDRCGLFLEYQGNLTQAITWLQRSVTSCQRLLGADHPDTLASRNDLAYTYRSAGDLQRAVPLYESTLADRERILGSVHTDTLISRSNLALAYQSAGRLQQAFPLYESTLGDSERLLGENHAVTLTIRNNLALAYLSAGEPQAAIPLYETTIRLFQRELGANHPDTLTTGNNLAGAYGSAGDLEHAIELYESTRAARERILGAHHPDTLLSGYCLAHAYQSAGDLRRSIQLYESTVTDCERILDPDHPYTLTFRNGLASAYQSVGDLQRAMPLYESVLTDRERILGPDHPDTLISRNNLATTYESTGDLRRAIAMYEDAFAVAERVLGAEHHSTLTLRGNRDRAQHRSASP